MTFAAAQLTVLLHTPPWQARLASPTAPSSIIGGGHLFQSRDISPIQNLGRTFYESVALQLLVRDGVGVISELRLDAAKAHRNGCPRGAEILIETADAAERLVQCGRYDAAGAVYEMKRSPPLPPLSSK